MPQLRMQDHEWVVYPRHRDQEAMFRMFAARAAPAAILMFNAGFGHGEAGGTYRRDPLHHASLDASEYEVVSADRALGQ